MDLITQNKRLERELRRCAADYPNISFASAWATSGNEVFKDLKKARRKLRKAVVGIHFYQTDPEVLAAFEGSEQLKVMLQPSGVFHPKVFLFWEDGIWQAFVGSANLTSGALTRNAEAVTHVTSDDPDGTFFTKLEKAIGGYFGSSQLITPGLVAKYRAAWVLRSRDRDRLADRFAGEISDKPALDAELTTLTWPELYRKVRSYENYLDQRIDLLSKAERAFAGTGRFSDMDQPTRYMIAGLGSDLVEDPGAFGSMTGSGVFAKAIKNNDAAISEALDEIPASGTVERMHYDRFIERYRRAFEKDYKRIGTASRLLALKRPDQFVCVDEENRATLCRSLGIRQSGMTYERYWDEIVERIRVSPWWNSPPPAQKTERAVWNGRAAFLDSIFYNAAQAGH